MALKLPQEIWHHIFKYLSVSDRLQCCQVCKDLHKVFIHAPLKMHHAIGVKINGNFELEGFEVIVKSGRIIGDLQFHHVKKFTTFWETCDMFENFMSNLTSIAFVGCRLESEDLLPILKHCSNLKRLKISACCFPKNKLTPLFTPDISEELSKHLGNVHELDLSDCANNRCFGNAHIEGVVNLFPSLMRINVSGSLQPIDERFELLFTPVILSDALTPNMILEILRKRATNIKELKIESSFVEDHFLDRLIEIPGLQLTSFDGSCCDFSLAALLRFCKHNPGLANLQMNYCNSHSICFDDPMDSLNLFSTLRHIKNLSLRGTKIPAGFDNCLAELKCIENLDLAKTTIPIAHIVEGFEQNDNNTLLSLDLTGVGLSAEDFAKILPSLVQLKKLTWSNLPSDEILQLIIKNLRNLKELNLNDNDLKNQNLTDFGFTGRPNSKAIESTHQVGKATKTKASYLDHPILAKITKMLQDTTSPIGSSSTIDSFSTIDSLNLTKLSLKMCELTDWSLKWAFTFKNLRHLDLSNCTRITDVGFLLVAKNNPFIETLILDATEITYKGLTQMVSHLPRLLHLSIRDCRNVDDSKYVERPNLQRGRCANFLKVHIVGVGTLFYNTEENTCLVPRLRRLDKSKELQES